MKISLVSFDQIWEDKSENRVLCEAYIKKAVAHGSELVIFPEMTLTAYSMNVEKNAEKIINSDSGTFFSEMAVRYNTSVIYGMCIEENHKYTNSLIFVDSSGFTRAIYHKIHPFSFASEDQFFLSGDCIQTLEFNDFKLGLAICYDLRFPELFRLYAEKTNLIVVIANWPEKRIDHWLSLLKARAIENQFFVAGVNRTGSDPKGNTYIHSSRIYTPTGIEVSPVVSDFPIDTYLLNVQEVEDWRRQFPALKDRKIYNLK